MPRRYRQPERAPPDTISVADLHTQAAPAGLGAANIVKSTARVE
jgi:hypothetical protein